MEDEKKKKRNNKKKKNKQAKTTPVDGAVGGGDQNRMANGQNDDVHSQASEPAEIQNVQDDRHHPDAAEKTILEETVKQLRNERESHIQIHATLEEKIHRLHDECDSHKEKVATLEETIKQLQNDNYLHTEKEATLEERLKQLQNQNDSHTQREGSLEMNIAKLQSEKEFLLQKQVDQEEKTLRLVDESAAVNMKRGSLEEKIRLLEADKDSWTQLESMSKETIAGLNVDITRLRMQVVELEDSRNNLLQENQELKEKVFTLRSHLSSNEFKKHTTSEQEDFNTQIEAAGALVDKLITENIELVEKVNELSVKLDRHSVTAGISSVIGSDVVTTVASDTEPMSESSDNMSSLYYRSGTQGMVAVKEDRNRANSVHADPNSLVTNSSEAAYSGEIVQIPLDDNESQDLESQVTNVDYVIEKEADVPLADAPLIGAPFRLVSFVAKYVSGADLISKNSSK